VFYRQELVIFVPLQTKLPSIAFNTFITLDKLIVRIICNNTFSELAVLPLSGDFHLGRNQGLAEIEIRVNYAFDAAMKLVFVLQCASDFGWDYIWTSRI